MVAEFILNQLPQEKNFNTLINETFIESTNRLNHIAYFTCLLQFETCQVGVMLTFYSYLFFVPHVLFHFLNYFILNLRVPFKAMSDFWSIVND